MIRAAIFDLDGVLLDSLSIWEDLGARYLRAKDITPEEGLGKTLFPMSMEQGTRYMKDRYALPESPEGILEGLKTLLEHFYFEEVPAKPGAEELLSCLKARGIPLAAATSSPRPHVTAALDRLGLLGYFQKVFTTGELGTSKHRPDIYLLAAKALGAKPEETLVLEDSLYALQTAKAAGFRTVGVFDPIGEPDQETLEQEAGQYVTSLSEVEIS